VDKNKQQGQKPVNGNKNYRNALWDERRALGLCLKVGEKYYPSMQGEIKYTC
jgi:hypothetical protein